MLRAERATIDFETRSACDLKRKGAWLYSKDPSTQILCLAYHLPGMHHDAIKLWHRAHPDLDIEESAPPTDLLEYIAAGGLVEAHNAMFEFFIWNHIAAKVYGWPLLKLEQMRCSAAKAAAHSLPRDLGGAGAALNLPVKKDERGKFLLSKLSKPKRLTKEERAVFGDDFVMFLEDADLLYELWQYCKQDVRAECRLSDSIADLGKAEQRLWTITQRMNMAGVQIDLDLCRSALRLAATARDVLNAELEELTGIPSGTQRAAVKNWLAANDNFEMADTKAKTIEWYIDRKPHLLTKRVKRILEIVKEVNRTSTNKYKRMLECVDTDGRARELLVFCGAERTGRFAGRGIQIHNLPKGKLPKGISMDTACEDVKSEDFGWCLLVYGDVMNLIASCLRGAIIAPPGRILWTADYSAIEARCVLWEAGADGALEVFREGGDIYCDMASGIYGYEIVKDEKAQAKKPGSKVAVIINLTGATQRDFGKVAILGLGYGMGWLKFLITLRTYNIYLTRAEVLKMMSVKRFKKYEAIVKRKLFPKPEDYEDEKKFKNAQREAKLAQRMLTDEREDPREVVHELALCKMTVDTYRTRYPEVPAMWKAQEAAAIQAVQHPGRQVKCGPVVWFVKGRFLKCRLPSGRCLHYADPHLAMAKTAWGETRPSLRFWGIDQKTKKWTRQHTYGGKLTENITQAIARDIMREAKLSLEHHPVYELLISVHDEIVTEADEGTGSREEFEELMATMPAGVYAGCPISAEAKSYARYRK